MTLREIIDTLKKEFPNEYSSFVIDVAVHSNAKPEIKIYLYTRTMGFVHGISFDDCLNKFRTAHPKEVPLDQEVPTMEV